MNAERPMLYRPLQTPDEQAFAHVLHACYDAPVDKVPDWWAVLGRDNVRVIEHRGEVVGGLSDIPMGWMQGGRRVALHGVCGVAVAPHARGLGLAKQMMTAYLRELHEREVPLSALYASTRGLYRSVGYGIAGRTYDTTVQTERFRGWGVRAEGWRPASESDREAVKAVHHRLVTQRGGFDRGPYLWARVWAFRGSPSTVLVCEREGELVAWVALRHEEREDDFMAVKLFDHGAVDADALARVAGLLSTYAAMAPTTVFKSGGEQELLDRMSENRLSQVLFEPWLMRVVRVRDAMQQRGWQGASGRVTLSVIDPVFPANEGPWAVEVEGGRARCEPVSDGSITIHVRGLAGLFSGGVTVEALHRRGLLDGSPEDRTRLQALFAAPTPSINEYF